MKYRQGTRVIHVRTDVRIEDNRDRLPKIRVPSSPASGKQY
jgi:hypothetical protein